MLKTKKGFTLIELLIVIVIIGILAVIVVGLVATNSRNRANDARKKADMREIQTALEQFRVDNPNYPQDAAAELVTNYLAAWPTSPDTHLYTYRPGGTPAATYQLEVQLANTTDSGPGVVPGSGGLYRLEQKQ